MATIEEVKKHLLDAGFEQRSKNVFRIGKIEIVTIDWHGTTDEVPIIRINIGNKDMTKDLLVISPLGSVEIHDVTAE